MTVFAGVMVVLLFIMIIKVGELQPHHGVMIDLPKVSHPVSMSGATKEDALIIGAMRDGQLFLLNERVFLKDLPSKITKHIAEGADRKIYLRADARVKYRVVKSILAEIRAAGFEDVGILTDQRRPPSVAD